MYNRYKGQELNMYMYDYSKQKLTNELKRQVCNWLQQRSES